MLNMYNFTKKTVSIGCEASSRNKNDLYQQKKIYFDKRDRR